MTSDFIFKTKIITRMKSKLGSSMEDFNVLVFFYVKTIPEIFFISLKKSQFPGGWYFG